MKNINPTIIRNNGIVISAVILVAFLLVGCKDNFTPPASPTGPTISSGVSANSNLSVLAAALTRTSQGLSLSNNNSGTFTLFAPSDSAFLVYFQGKLGKPAYTVDSVLNYINVKMSTSSTITVSALSSVLTYHIISSNLPEALLVGPQTFATLNGARLSISKQGSNVLLNAYTSANGAKVIAFDTQASNGVIHTINRVLVPVTVATAASVVGVGINYGTTPATITVTTTANYTVFATAIQRAGINVASVILPNTSPLPEVTIFAPTDAAFITYLNVANQAAALTAIKAMDTTTLNPLLRYHLIAKTRILTTDLTDGESIKTLNGASITVHLGSAITLTDLNAASADAKITSANNLTNAGVVHGIDTVLQPN
jgi:uncharacterized surface protein with fasciclin (FAS1) repeats